MTLNLSNEEHTLLVSVLVTHLAELREEIHRTEDYTFKMNLKSQKTTLDRLLSTFLADKELTIEGVGQR